MFSISTNDLITMSRGDSVKTCLFLNIGTDVNPLIYDLGSTDKVYFGLMEPNQPFEDAILKKVFTYLDYDYENHCLCIKLKPEDTENLLPGNYYYSVKLYRKGSGTILTTEDDKVDTIISKRKFTIID